MNLNDVIILLACAAALAIVWQHLNVSHRAYDLAQEYTQKQGVQLLDQSTILKRMRLKTDAHTLLTIVRDYHFEFSTVGDVRYKGELSMRGLRLVHIALQPHKNDVSDMYNP